MIPFVHSYGEMFDRVKEFVLMAKGLVGEVFKEEPRQLTDLYHKVLLLLGEGV
ncbi:hypothetical protein GCM10007116_15280 [Sulfodiicoccus acidiphilus]|uniref:Uncharacterized protein n=1 Tax=Sulfodiicoccus acidiphilus TaxID=1670455 RepID=A0A830H5H2_9CREN|nr:hypothetical protein [Sulfodiicoccus acidiphilus]GGT98810.1 hypothetical protein GCM10007116_15280 [Sulfodiicoccus acidiphilus]